MGSRQNHGRDRQVRDNNNTHGYKGGEKKEKKE
jgi:hypothetical protein